MLNRFDNWFFSLGWPWSFLIIVVFMVGFAFTAFRKKHLTISGSISAFVIGVVIFQSVHIQGFLLIFSFYFSSYALGKCCASKHENVIEKKGHIRDYMQVFANGLMAAISALQYVNTMNIRYLVVFGAVIAEATSDTWAGEIGRLSSKPPVSIRTFQVVPKGLSGGVTPMGFLGGFAGSFIIAIVWWVLFLYTGISFFAVFIVTLCSFSGCVFDSFLGATCQAMYLDEKNDALTEQDIDEDGNKRKLIRGIRWLDNDFVNLISNLFSAMLAYTFSIML